MTSGRLDPPAGVEAASRSVLALYFAAVSVLFLRIAWLDEWSIARFVVLAAFLATVVPDRVPGTSKRALGLAVAFFAILSGAVTYLPDLWFGIAYQLNHAKNYFWNANAWMRSVPFNDGAFLWAHSIPWLASLMRWVYMNGFDMVVWIPVMRSLLALDARKMARYALAAHLIQFPLIMPFYSAFRVDEVWSVLGDPDRLGRGWSDEMRLDIGANCFPSMHTSVAFAILLLGLRERSRPYAWMMSVYASAIIFSTMYMEVHWLIDVAGGLALGAGSVKLVDLLLARLDSPRAQSPI